MSIIAFIPARFQSTRLPGKPLAHIGNITMIERVYNQVKLAKQIDEVVIATDHESIFEEAFAFGAKVVMTSADHPSGTDRIAEAIQHFGQYDFVINVQGDEPFINPNSIDLLASLLKNEVELATLVQKISDTETLFNQNIPKVVLNNNQEAIYFSRHTIPFLRDVPPKDWLGKTEFYKHIGLYGYRKDILQKICQLAPSPLENAEKLEQLRWLHAGYKIKVGITSYDSFGVDTPSDLAQANIIAKKKL